MDVNTSPSTTDSRFENGLRDSDTSSSSYGQGSMYLKEESDSIVASGRHIYSEDDESTSTDVSLGLFFTGGNFGAAYYDHSIAQLFLIKDATDSFPNHELLKCVLMQVNPTRVIVSARLHEDTLNVIKGCAYRTPLNKEDPTIVYHHERNFIEILPNVDFGFESSKRRLAAIDLSSISASYSASERIMHLQSLIDFSCSSMVKAAGALLRFLDKSRIGTELDESGIKVPVMAISTISLKDSVSIDEVTLSVLKIFHKENHPSVYKSGFHGMKEGFSLYSIFNICHSPLGHRRLKLMFLRPSQDVELLTNRQNVIGFFKKPCNEEIMHLITSHLKNIKNIPKLLADMKRSGIKVTDWLTLYKALYHSIMIGSICKNLPQSMEIFRKIADAFTSDLMVIAHLIQKIVDFDESIERARFTVKYGVSKDIDNKKRIYLGLPDLLTNVARIELHRLDSDIEECNVIYIPQLGYLLTFQMTPAQKMAGDYSISGLDFVFMSNDRVYYRSPGTKELDNFLGDTEWDIADAETKVMNWLQNKVLGYSVLLIDIINLTAELDCLITMAVLAKELNFVRPTFTKEATIDIRNGRNLLQEIFVDSFVPNDTISNAEVGKAIVITGANSSGKSVYIKQVALIVYLAHIGSFVPADSARLGVVDKIFAKLEVNESISTGLSTFLIDLHQICGAVRGATSRSIVVIDEFGKGTCSADGLALLNAILKHWLKQGPNCPHIFLNTQFYSVLKLCQEHEKLRSKTMNVMADKDSLVMLYKLVDHNGIHYSYSHTIASEAGIKDSIISRAKEVATLMKESKCIRRVASKQVEESVKRSKMIVSKFKSLDLSSLTISRYFTELLQEQHP